MLYLRELLQKATSLKHLQELVLQEGELLSEKQLVTRIDSLVEDRAKTILQTNKPEQITDLPGTTVTRNGIEYVIHGIYHANPPFIRAKPSVRKFLQEQVEKYSHKGSGCFTEYGLCEAYCLEDCKKLEDCNFIALMSKRERILFVKKIMWDLIKIGSSIVFKSQQVCFRTKIAFAAVYDITYLPLARKATPSTSGLISEPLGMQLKKYNDGTPWVQLCSKSMADELIRRAEKDRLQTVHAIVGIGHESQIAYFLNQKTA